MTEPDYCTALNNNFGDQYRFWIETQYVHKNGLKPTEVAEYAVEAATDVKERGGRGADASPHPLGHVWALFDRDEHAGVQAAFARLRRHNAETAKRGTARRIEIAFSSPSFDLWMLLHFQMLTNPQYGSNDLVHAKLSKYPEFGNFASGTSGSKRINVGRAEQLMRLERIQAAVTNARALIRQCPTVGCSPATGHGSDCDPLWRDPSTDLWRLIESLGIVRHNR